MTTRERILTLSDGGHEPHMIAAFLGLGVTEVARTLAEPEYTPSDPDEDSGGGGGLPVQWTVHSGALDMAPTDATVGVLFQIKAPSQFAEDSGAGLIAAIGEDGHTRFKIDDFGLLQLCSPAEEPQSQIVLLSEAHSDYEVALASGHAGSAQLRATVASAERLKLVDGVLHLTDLAAMEADTPLNLAGMLKIASSQPGEAALRIEALGGEASGLEVHTGSSVLYTDAKGNVKLQANAKENPAFHIGAPAGTWGIAPSNIGGLLDIEQESYVFTVEAGGGITVWDGKGDERSKNQMWWITKHGYEAVQARGAPNDEDILPGQVFSWFDDTPGECKFIRRGRDSEGKIVQVVSNLT